MSFQHLLGNHFVLEHQCSVCVWVWRLLTRRSVTFLCKYIFLAVSFATGEGRCDRRSPAGVLEARVPSGRRVPPLWRSHRDSPNLWPLPLLQAAIAKIPRRVEFARLRLFLFFSLNGEEKHIPRNASIIIRRDIFFSSLFLECRVTVVVFLVRFWLRCL